MTKTMDKNTLKRRFLRSIVKSLLDLDCKANEVRAMLSDPEFETELVHTINITANLLDDADSINIQNRSPGVRDNYFAYQEPISEQESERAHLLADIQGAVRNVGMKRYQLAELIRPFANKQGIDVREHGTIADMLAHFGRKASIDSMRLICELVLNFPAKPDLYMSNNIGPTRTRKDKG